MTCHIIISSKNFKSICNFIYFLINYTNLIFFVITKKFQKITKKNIFCVLKSPHVNKSAQEQLEIRTFSKQFSLKTIQSLKYLIFLKKISFELFPDVKIKIKIKINNSSNKKLCVKILNFDNYNINKVYNINKNSNNRFYYSRFYYNRKKNSKKKKLLLIKKLNNFLKLIEIYGKLLKN